jgi:hypothetical protein
MAEEVSRVGTACGGQQSWAQRRPRGQGAKAVRFPGVWARRAAVPQSPQKQSKAAGPASGPRLGQARLWLCGPV